MDGNVGEFRRRQEVGVLFVFQITGHQLHLGSAPFHLDIFRRSNQNPRADPHSAGPGTCHTEDSKQKFLRLPLFLSPALTSSEPLINGKECVGGAEPLEPSLCQCTPGEVFFLCFPLALRSAQSLGHRIVHSRSEASLKESSENRRGMRL